MKDLRTTTIGQFPDSTPIDILSRTGRWYFDSSKLSLDHINARAAFEAAPVALALCDLSGDLLCANRLFITCLELGSQESVAGRNLAHTCRVLDLSAFMDKLPSTDEICEMEMTLRSDAQGSRRILCKGQRIAGADCAPRWLVVSLSPLPDAFERSEWIAHGLANAEQRAGIAHWCMPCQHGDDPANLDMFWSLGAAGVVGKRAAGQRSVDWLACMTLDHRSLMQQSLAALMEQGIPMQVDYQLVDENGMPGRVVQSCGWRIERTDAAGYMLVGTVQLHEAESSEEEALQHMTLMGRNLFGDSDWPVCMLDNNMKLTYSNHMFRTYLCSQSGKGDMAGLSLQQVISDASARRQLLCNVRHAMRGQRRAETIQVDMDGMTREFDINFLPLRDESHGLLGVMIVGILVTRGRLTT